MESERSRIRAALVNSGRYTFAEADKKLSALELDLFLSECAASTPAGQAAFLTAAITATRCFGNVSVSGALEHAITLPLPLRAGDLRAAAVSMGAMVGSGESGRRQVAIGPPLTRASSSVQAYWNGWIAGSAPGGVDSPMGRGDCVLAGAAAGALAVGQAFIAETGNPLAGRRMQSMSLWEPDGAEGQNVGPRQADCYLPTSLWLIGLGNLGQAYLWSLAMLPYQNAASVLLYLQDDDSIRKENWGTSILVQRDRYGVLKTRVGEEWAEARGFLARRIDRRLDEHLRRTPDEPAIALAGLDRMAPRRLLGNPGFDFVVDAGLGATFRDYQKLRINVFDQAHSPDVHFQGVEDRTDVDAIVKLPAYKEIAEASPEARCGAALLAAHSVAVPFVSAFASAIAITQAIRIASACPPHSVLTADLADLRSVRATPGQAQRRPSAAGERAAT